jgi:hypothetical protein
MKPLVTKHQVRSVDYFVWLTVNAGPGFRQVQQQQTQQSAIAANANNKKGNYMNYLTYDPVIRPAFESTEDHNIKNEQPTIYTDLHRLMTSTIRQATKVMTSSNIDENKGVDSTVNLRTLRVLMDPLEDGPVLDELRQRLQDASSSSSLYDVFPMIDHRPHAKDRTRIGNKNMIRLFLAIETLWDEHVVKTEHELQQQYDYVLILRDDTYWIDDFDLERVIQTNPKADAYVLSCNARQPSMLPPELNDHGILIKRSTAHVVGKYLTSMVRSPSASSKGYMLDECHKSVQRYVGSDRGCNSEMILKYILQKNNVTVQLVPQSVMPFERSVIVKHHQDVGSDSHEEYCLHKYCQSLEEPLKLPPDLRHCKDIKL